MWSLHEASIRSGRIWIRVRGKAKGEDADEAAGEDAGEDVGEDVMVR